MEAIQNNYSEKSDLRVDSEQIILDTLSTGISSISRLLAPWGDRIGVIKLNVDGARWRIDMLDDRVERASEVLEDHTRLLNEIRRGLLEHKDAAKRSLTPGT